ncbi:MAG: iron export ABC transporter permease subunit FetB [Planctomycetota bacterium]
MARVLVLGGGVAGMCAALAHRERGDAVRLVERSPRLGGRAWSGRTARDEAELDNGPHVLLGCYRAFRRLLAALGSADGFWAPPELRLTWLAEGGTLHRLRPPPLPAPLHLVAGLLGIDGLGLGARLGLLAAGLRPFLPLPRDDVDLATWMRRKHVGDAARRLLYEPLCRAVLNLDCDRAEAGLFLQTLREAFLGGRAHSALWVPRRPWGALLDEPGRRVLPERGVELLLGSTVAAIEPAGRRSPRVRLADGRVLDDHDRLVLALPWRAAATLLAGTRLGAAAAALDGAAILSVFLDLPAGTLPFDDPVVALAGGAPFHFLTRPCDERGHAVPGAPVGPAGGGPDLPGRTARDTVELALAQLSRWLGRREPWPDAVRLTARLRREAEATFRPLCGRAAAGRGPGRPRSPACSSAATGPTPACRRRSKGPRGAATVSSTMAADDADDAPALLELDDQPGLAGPFGPGRLRLARASWPSSRARVGLGQDAPAAPPRRARALRPGQLPGRRQRGPRPAGPHAARPRRPAAAGAAAAPVHAGRAPRPGPRLRRQPRPRPRRRRPHPLARPARARPPARATDPPAVGRREAPRGAGAAARPRPGPVPARRARRRPRPAPRRGPGRVRAGLPRGRQGRALGQPPGPGAALPRRCALPHDRGGRPGRRARRGGRVVIAPLQVRLAEGPVDLAWTDLALVSACLLINVVLSFRFRLAMQGTLLMAGLRTVVQLTLVGFVLQRVFAVDEPALVLGILCVMVLIAGWEIARRSSHRFAGRYLVSVGAMALPAFLMAAYAVLVVIRPERWSDPRYLIPLMGMILGNSLTAVNLTMNRYTQAVVEHRKEIEHLLSLGATANEAMLPHAREAVRTGMTPMINAMLIVGVVSLPGMMTGQILGGTPPLLAVRYQIVIMFVLAGTTALGSALCVLWLRRRLFDARDRIRL